MNAHGALESAGAYLGLGWCVIPVLPRDKAPGWNGCVRVGWERLRLTTADLPQYFTQESNIGVLLGEPSGHLVDVDLDCAEAIELAPRFLPRTWVFGRLSKQRSHWLYLSKGAAAERFRAPSIHGEQDATLLELRGCNRDGRGSVGQTVFPPSVHKCGEPISWDEDGDSLERPTSIEAAKLRARVAKLAAACLAMRYAGRAATEAWLQGADCPALPTEAATRIRQWWGLSVPRPAQSAPLEAGVIPANVKERARRYLARIPPAISGSGGHVQTLLAAEHLVRGFRLDDDTAFELLANDYSPRCEPPWSERELSHKVKQAREKGTAVGWGQHLRDGRCHG